MLVGMTPFRGDNIKELKNNILKKNYNIPDYISIFGQKIILRMLETDVEKRIDIFDLKVSKKNKTFLNKI